MSELVVYIPIVVTYVGNQQPPCNFWESTKKVRRQKFPCSPSISQHSIEWVNQPRRSVCCWWHNQLFCIDATLIKILLMERSPFWHRYNPCGKFDWWHTQLFCSNAALMEIYCWWALWKFLLATALVLILHLFGGCSALMHLWKCWHRQRNMETSV